jgi:hypothetical protein
MESMSFYVVDHVNTIVYSHGFPTAESAKVVQGRLTRATTTDSIAVFDVVEGRHIEDNSDYEDYTVKLLPEAAAAAQLSQQAA